MPDIFQHINHRAYRLNPQHFAGAAPRHMLNCPDRFGDVTRMAHSKNQYDGLARLVTTLAQIIDDHAAAIAESGMPDAEHRAAVEAVEAVAALASSLTRAHAPAREFFVRAVAANDRQYMN